jgi:ABC-type glycerol-3-phosphate transport system substrate-binding protein
MKSIIHLVCLVVCIFLCAGCGRASEEGVIRIWSHQGQEAENLAMREMVAAFNEAHAAEGIRAVIDFFPDYQYTERLAIAAAAGDLPDVFDLDGPTVAQFVDAGVLRPIGDFFTEAELADFLDTIIAQGTVDGTLYALGAFDSAMVLYYDKVLLEAAGVLLPPSGSSWSWSEFVDACERLKAAGHDPVALHMDVTADEWYTYAFSPLIWSGGGALLDVEANMAAGVLNSERNVAALSAWQQLFERGLAARSPIQPDPFGAGETAMDWNGHWMARSHLAAKGERLGVLPLPRMGAISAAPCGSWCWAISAVSEQPEQAARWLRWVLDPVTGVAPMVRAGGAVPARQSAFAAFPEYERDPFRLFRLQLEQYGRPRPQTPHYPVVTQQFAAALRDIAGGADPRTRLDLAAAAVQRVLDRGGR